LTKSDHCIKKSVNGFLLNEIHRGTTVQSLLNSVFDIWHYPSLFLDFSRNIEYYSRRSSEHDPWGSLFENGVFSHDHLDGPISDVLSRRRSENKRDHMAIFSVDDQTYILALVRYGNIPIGYVMMNCSLSGSDDEAAEICSSVSDAITFLIEKDPAVHLSDFDYTRNYIARELLQFDEKMGNASPDAGSVDYSTSPLRPKIKPYYRIAAISVADNESDRLRAANKEIYRVYPKSYSLIKANTLYVFLYGIGDEDEGTEKELRGSLSTVAMNNSVAIALSSRFRDMNRRNVFRRQAVDLSRRCRTGDAGKVLDADDYYPELILLASEKRIGIEPLMLSEFVYLKDYDEANGTEYLKTLCCYLRCNGIIRSAATKLHLEPKSLRYRIKKICGILNRSREDLLSDEALLLSSITSCKGNE